MRASRLRSDEELLLLGRELDHAPAAAGIAQRREDPAGHTKVRVAHVSGFGRAGQAQSEASELAGLSCEALLAVPRWFHSAGCLAGVALPNGSHLKLRL